MSPTPQNDELDQQIDKMLTWNIQGHTEPVVFQPEMKQAIKQLIDTETKAAMLRQRAYDERMFVAEKRTRLAELQGLGEQHEQI